MNKTKYAKAMKVVYTILMVLILVSVANTVFAGSSSSLIDPGSLTGEGASGGTQIESLGNQIIGIVTMIGIVISVLVLVILGIKYMIGSAQEKAEYKKTMIPYVIGAILVFAASTIATIVMNIADGIQSTNP